MVTQTYNLSTWEVKADVTEIHDRLQVHSKFQASLDNMQPFQKASKKTVKI